MTKIISFLFGIIANCRFPRPLQRFINAQYVKAFKIDLSEFQRLHYYKSLNELFTRGLRQMRTFDRDGSIFISPSDGKITQCGEVKNTKALQIKGFSYSVERLLGESGACEGMAYANIYLSPSNYHRYHAPCDMEVLSITHFNGALHPVHMRSLQKNRNLFIINERVVLKARDNAGNLLYFVAIGALNVGQMIFYIEPRLQEKHPQYKRVFTYNMPRKIQKGEEIGMFKMGSTIVLFASNVEILQTEGRISFGDRLFARKGEDNGSNQK